MSDRRSSLTGTVRSEGRTRAEARLAAALRDVDSVRGALAKAHAAKERAEQDIAQLEPVLANCKLLLQARVAEMN